MRFSLHAAFHCTKKHRKSSCCDSLNSYGVPPLLARLHTNNRIGVPYRMHFSLHAVFYCTNQLGNCVTLHKLTSFGVFPNTCDTWQFHSIICLVYEETRGKSETRILPCAVFLLTMAYWHSGLMC